MACFEIYQDKLIPRKKGQYTDLYKRSGVYCFFDENNDPLYVGSTKNLYQRFIAHIGTGGMFYHFKWNKFRAFYTNDYRELEREILKKYKIPLNGIGCTSIIWRTKE